MRKLIFFMHASLDGFVAGPNGEMNWIKVDNEIFDFVATMTDQADAALYGRVTYQMMEAYWPTAGEKPNASQHDIEHSEWYKKVLKVVLSGTMKQTGQNSTMVISENISENINRIKQQDGKNILIFGSPSASKTLLNMGLSAGGQIEAPIGDSPWGTYFGMFRDKYGIEWMVNFDPKFNG